MRALAGSRQLFAHHHPDEALLVDIDRESSGYRNTVPEHGYPVRELKEFIEPVGNVNDSGPCSAQLVDDGEELFHFLPGQRCSRLVKDQDSSVGAQSPRYFNQLLLGHGQLVDEGFCVNMSADLL